ncbi:putative protein serine/threonine kinase [Tieghemostelium lacteum]|uniref:non-specific serine/threonine protein kinase n=1 Tax=Tieghemostelium lacteum TaxID=361077 RepID=A0A151Z903_TIELA|nr:putative protein serine/threonine kinase [Tieghemostelium lacteum]|eukprot:KYQ90409.1 putative protein serine/threonine kinase [Tieghemostelium lacteum]
MSLTASDISQEDPEQLFRVLEVIGQGSFGVVCTCINTQSNQVVAIKFVEMETDENSSLKREITILKNTFQCPYIVRYHGCYLKENNLMIVMEYCDGGSILDIMQMCKRTLTEIQISAILYQVLEGLIYLHDHKILHRDIKAGNVLVNQKGEAKLADFGVSAILVNTGFKQKTVVGSPYWMSPEVISLPKGSTGYDSKADIWSLGITAIEMAESKPPNFNLTPIKVIFVIPFRNPPTLEKPDQWSREFNDFVTQCLKKESEKRPTAKDLLNHPFILKGKDKAREIISELVEECIPLMKEYRRQKAEEEEQDQDENSSNGTVNPSSGGTTTTTSSSNTVQKGTLLKINTKTQTATIMDENGINISHIKHPSRNHHQKGSIALGTDDLSSQNSGTVVYGSATFQDDSEDSGSVVFKGTLQDQFEKLKLKYEQHQAKIKQQQVTSSDDDYDEDDDDEDENSDNDDNFKSGSVVFTK